MNEPQQDKSATPERSCESCVWSGTNMTCTHPKIEECVIDFNLWHPKQDKSATPVSSIQNCGSCLLLVCKCPQQKQSNIACSYIITREQLKQNNSERVCDLSCCDEFVICKKEKFVRCSATDVEQERMMQEVHNQDRVHPVDGVKKLKTILIKATESICKEEGMSNWDNELLEVLKQAEATGYSNGYEKGKTETRKEVLAEVREIIERNKTTIPGIGLILNCDIILSELSKLEAK